MNLYYQNGWTGIKSFIIFNKNKKARFTGSNAFPVKWDTFCNNIRLLIGRDFR